MTSSRSSLNLSAFASLFKRQDHIQPRRTKEGQPILRASALPTSAPATVMPASVSALAPQLPPLPFQQRLFNARITTVHSNHLSVSGEDDDFSSLLRIQDFCQIKGSVSVATTTATVLSDAAGPGPELLWWSEIGSAGHPETTYQHKESKAEQDGSEPMAVTELTFPQSSATKGVQFQARTQAAHMQEETLTARICQSPPDADLKTAPHPRQLWRLFEQEYMNRELPALPKDTATTPSPTPGILMDAFPKTRKDLEADTVDANDRGLCDIRSQRRKKRLVRSHKDLKRVNENLRAWIEGRQHQQTWMLGESGENYRRRQSRGTGWQALLRRFTHSATLAQREAMN